MAASKFAFEGVITDSSKFKSVIDGFKDMVKECNFDINEGGIQVQTTDSSNVALVHLMMKEALFETFTCHEPITVGINVENFAKILKLCGTNDKITMKVEKVTKKQTLLFESTEDGRIAQFEMKSFEIEQDALGVPETDYEAVLQIPTSGFKKAVSDLKDAGDQIQITATSEGVRFQIVGDMGSGFVLLWAKESGNEEEQVKLDLKKDVSLRFGMRYVHLFTRAAALSKSATIWMSTGEPAKFQFNLGDEAHGFLRFVLAPKLGDDD